MQTNIWKLLLQPPRDQIREVLRPMLSRRPASWGLQTHVPGSQVGRYTGGSLPRAAWPVCQVHLAGSRPAACVTQSPKARGWAAPCVSPSKPPDLPHQLSSCFSLGLGVGAKPPKPGKGRLPVCGLSAVQHRAPFTRAELGRSQAWTCRGFPSAAPLASLAWG